MSTATQSFDEYSVCVSDEPEYYGPNCTQADAYRIAENLSGMVMLEFPGITVTTYGRPVCGPDSETCEEIRQWVETNWTAAL